MPGLYSDMKPVTGMAVLCDVSFDSDLSFDRLIFPSRSRSEDRNMLPSWPEQCA